MCDSADGEEEEEPWIRSCCPYQSQMEIEELDEYSVRESQMIPNRVVSCCVDCAEITEISAIVAEKLNNDRANLGMPPLQIVKVIYASKQRVSGRLFCLHVLFKLTQIYSFAVYRRAIPKIIADNRSEEIATFDKVPGGRWRLLDGNFMPKIGLQCSAEWNELEAEQWILAALEAGLRLFDFTFFGHNRGQISKAIKGMNKFLPWFGLYRSDVFISAKVNIVRPDTAKRLFAATHDIDEHQFHSVSDYAHFCVGQCAEQFDEAVLQEISDMCQKNKDDREAVYGVLEHYLEVGTIRSIGTANFEPDHIEHLVKAGHRLPAVVQCEMHPFLQREDLLDYCKSKGIFMQAHSIFAYKKQTPSYHAQHQRYAQLKSVASLYGIGTSQLSLAYIMHCSPQVGAVFVEEPDDLFDHNKAMSCGAARTVLISLVSSVDIPLSDKHMRAMQAFDLGKLGKGGGCFTMCQQWKVM